MDNREQDNYEQELAAERARYRDILAIIEARLRAADDNREKSAGLLREAGKDMWENAPRFAGGLPLELNQYYLPVASGAAAVDSAAGKLRLLRRMRQSAYFARVDFRVAGDALHETFYIGVGTLMDEKKINIHIYDWRSPVASLFYRFETGDAFYDAPIGRIAGDIALKRQYEIKNGVFEYFFDADVQIADQFLRKMLSGNTAGKMKAIVETIQKDQDIAIRDMAHDLLMVQGVAGSGKTSVALHRVAYLKYQGLADRLESSAIMILSPNTLFEQYISNVLPELGEDEVTSAVFDELLKSCLPSGTAFQTRYEKLEELISRPESTEKALQKRTAEFKLSGAFARILERYAKSLPAEHIAFTDIEYDGKTVFTAAELRDRLLRIKGSLSLATRLSYLRRDIFDRIHELREDRIARLQRQARADETHVYDWAEYVRALSIEEHTRLAKQIDAFVRPDTVALYKKLLAADGLLLSFCEDTPLPDAMGEALRRAQPPEDAPLPNEDALAVAYLRLLIGTGVSHRHIRQLVVDEAQDYYHIHYEILRRLFPNARYTVLGDVNQTIEKREDIELYERIARIMRAKSASLITMNKSFRCTKEILAFGMRFLDGAAPFESFNRTGDEPQVIYASDAAALDDMLLAEAEYGRARGYESIAIICKDARQAEALYGRLKDKTALRLIRAGDSLSTAGVLIIPITMSKGLEFDSVLVYGTDGTNYRSDDDRRLLYIASTRALHRLNLFYTGQRSPWLRGMGAGGAESETI